jgi:hypothetical protein
LAQRHYIDWGRGADKPNRPSDWNPLGYAPSALNLPNVLRGVGVVLARCAGFFDKIYPVLLFGK